MQTLKIPHRARAGNLDRNTILPLCGALNMHAHNCIMLSVSQRHSASRHFDVCRSSLSLERCDVALRWYRSCVAITPGDCGFALSLCLAGSEAKSRARVFEKNRREKTSTQNMAYMTLVNIEPRAKATQRTRYHRAVEQTNQQNKTMHTKRKCDHHIYIRQCGFG